MKHTPQPQKKPDALKPPTPTVEVTALALGKTTQGLHCVALLTLQANDEGRRPDGTSFAVTSVKVLAASRDAEVVEQDWDARAYPLLYLGEACAERQGHTFASGKALALMLVPKTLRSLRTATVFEVDGGRSTGMSVIYEGGKLDAWAELSDWASRHLLVASNATRRKRA